MSIAIGETVISSSFSGIDIVLPSMIGLITLVDELVGAYYEHTSSMHGIDLSDSIAGLAPTYIYFAFSAILVALQRVLATSRSLGLGIDLPKSEFSESVASLVDFDDDSRFY